MTALDGKGANHKARRAGKTPKFGLGEQHPVLSFQSRI